jgi:hypothetical protein
MMSGKKTREKRSCEAWKHVNNAQRSELENWRAKKAQFKADGKRFTEPAPKLMKKKEWVERHWQGSVDNDDVPMDDDEADDI